MTRYSGADARAKPSRYRFVIFGLGLALAVVNYIDRGAMSYASQAIMTEYRFGPVQWGIVLGSFGYGYLFGALLGGALADRWGPRRVWLIAGVSWSILEMLTAWAGDAGLAIFGGSALTGFVAVRILFGFTEGPVYSTLSKTAAYWAPASERGLILSIGLLSAPLGALLTAPIAVSLQLLTGSWRAMFIALGFLGVVILAVFARVFTDRPADNSRVSPQELAHIQRSRPPGSAARGSERSTASAWLAFFRSRTLVCNSAGYFALVYVTFLLLTWAPRYLQDAFHLSLTSLGFWGIVPWIGACATILIGGHLSDLLNRATGNLTVARSCVAAVSLALTTLTFVAVSRATTPASAIALLTLANALSALPNSIYWAVIIDTAPAELIGLYSGTTHFLANIAVVLAPTLTGYLIAQYDYSAMFVAAAVVTSLGSIAMCAVRPGLISPVPPIEAAKST